VQYTPFSLADSGALPVRKMMCFRARDRDVTSNQKDASGFEDLLNAFHCPPYLPVAASFGVDESLWLQHERNMRIIIIQFHSELDLHEREMCFSKC